MYYSCRRVNKNDAGLCAGAVYTVAGFDIIGPAHVDICRLCVKMRFADRTIFPCSRSI